MGSTTGNRGRWIVLLAERSGAALGSPAWLPGDHLFVFAPAPVPDPPRRVSHGGERTLESRPTHATTVPCGATTRWQPLGQTNNAITVLDKARGLAALITSINLTQDLGVHRRFRGFSLGRNHAMLTCSLCNFTIVERLLPRVLIEDFLGSIRK